MSEENAQETPKEESKSNIKHFARYTSEIPQILRAKGGKEIWDIYLARGFVEVEESEYLRILAIKRSVLENGSK